MVGQAGSSGANGSSRRVRLLYRCRLIRKDCGGYAVNSSRGVRQPSANRLPTATIQSRQVPTAYTAGPVEPSRLPRMRPTLMPAGRWILLLLAVSALPAAALETAVPSPHVAAGPP